MAWGPIQVVLLAAGLTGENKGKHLTVAAAVRYGGYTRGVIMGSRLAQCTASEMMQELERSRQEFNHVAL
jgi:hypothetical protein